MYLGIFSFIHLGMQTKYQSLIMRSISTEQMKANFSQWMSHWNATKYLLEVPLLFILKHGVTSKFRSGYLIK